MLMTRRIILDSELAVHGMTGRWGRNLRQHIVPIKCDHSWYTARGRLVRICAGAQSSGKVQQQAQSSLVLAT